MSHKWLRSMLENIVGYHESYAGNLIFYKIAISCTVHSTASLYEAC